MSGNADPNGTDVETGRPTDGETGGTEPTVLVIEDEPDLAELYAAHLSDEYRVRTALSGEEALDELDEHVDVVLLDRKMPGMSGDQVLRELSRREYGCQIAMVTAVTPETEIVDFAVMDYLTKPVSGMELRQTVARLLAIGSHEDLVREFVELSMKQVALEAENDPVALEDDPEYRRLDERLAELATTLGDLSEELSVSEFELFLEGLVSRMTKSESE
jgi:DNA-binding response OmpR family regulator